MFGVPGTGDTSGYGGLVAPVVYPAAAERPYGGWFDVVADGLDPLIESVVIHRGEITFHISPRQPGRGGEAAARRPEACASSSAPASAACTTRTTRARAARGLQLLVDDATTGGSGSRSASPTPTRTCRRCAGSIPAVDWHERETYDMFGLDLRRPPGAHPDPDARRLAGPPAAQGLPARRHPGRVQGRHHPTAGPAEVLLMTHPGRLRRLVGDQRRHRSSPSPARTGTTSRPASATRAATRRSGSSSTWARSTRRPTACSG